MKNYISPTAVIGKVKFGKNIYIGNNASIGTQPQYVGFSKKKLLENKFKNLHVDDNVVIMDLCHIDAGIKRNTKIGKNSMIMSGTYLGHDVHIGINCNISPKVAIAGGVTLNNDVTVGMGATIHQGLTIGSCSMIGMGAAVINDIPPFVTYAGVPAKKIKVNKIKLERLGISRILIDHIQEVLLKDRSLKKIKLSSRDNHYYQILERWVKKGKVT